MGKKEGIQAARNKRLVTKTPRKPRPKNRYMRGAKLTEYRFLKVLKGFADDETTSDLAAATRISEKTIRTTYRKLRDKLIEAVVMNRHDFNGAGFYLLPNGKMDQKGKRFLQGVAESKLFSDHLEKHARRLRSQEDLQEIIFEVSIRGFCNIKMKEGALVNYSPETRNALKEMKEIGDWIRENIDKEEFISKYGHVVERFHELSANMKLLLE